VSLVLLQPLWYPPSGVIGAPVETIAGTQVPAQDVLLIALACAGALAASPYLRDLPRRWMLAGPGSRALSLAATAGLLLGISALVYRMIA
jgi:hypothetical protein